MKPAPNYQTCQYLRKGPPPPPPLSQYTATEVLTGYRNVCDDLSCMTDSVETIEGLIIQRFNVLIGPAMLLEELLTSGSDAGAPGQGGPQQQLGSLPPPPPPPPTQMPGQFSDAPAALPPPPPPPSAPAGGLSGYPVQLPGAPVSLPPPSSAAVAAVAAAAAALRGTQVPPPQQSPHQQRQPPHQQQQHQPPADQSGPVSPLCSQFRPVFEAGSQLRLLSICSGCSTRPRDQISRLP